jgi:hypothetical protein
MALRARESGKIVHPVLRKSHHSCRVKTQGHPSGSTLAGPSRLFSLVVTVGGPGEENHDAD